ncbi:hypothetical protein LguiA_009973 [Lonicera macranthoides]
MNKKESRDSVYRALWYIQFCSKEFSATLIFGGRWAVVFHFYSLKVQQSSSSTLYPNFLVSFSIYIYMYVLFLP